ncbi:hypothetical protein [Dinghuibacter silviterrae]|uniref:Uncharacterized protein n=1 Tax=Dinghuibacter silviterrae TaxID=1539049 RepID=A0A4R8DIU2_9BACT|nr:hypothetical protein [Dinghuibacter silviterrae]TDW97096.1 hypothetical protein EDB95_4936 [Dinghuibacter silviterrae]
MVTIEREDAQACITGSAARYFVILLEFENGLLEAWRGFHFSGVAGDNRDITLIPREQALEQYKKAGGFGADFLPGQEGPAKLRIIPVM